MSKSYMDPIVPRKDKPGFDFALPAYRIKENG
jgi:hypothetical protein